jgi:competence protein ComEA
VAAAIVLIVTAVAVTVVIGIVRTASSPVDTVEGPGPVAVTAPAPAVAYVHVFGAVAKPGLYRLEAGARVVDVVAAAGGFAVDAEPSGVNLARAVTDGEQLRVPRIGESPPPAEGREAGVTVDGLVNLNTADEAALDTLPRIGPALAGRIIAWRDENGSFTSVEDLLAVPGIGEKMLASLRDLVTL